MKRTGSVILVVLGVALILFGLLFLLGAAGRWYRLVTAGVALVLGAVLTGLGIRFFKQVDMTLPEYIRAEIMDMARLHNGEISEDDIRAKLESAVTWVWNSPVETSSQANPNSPPAAPRAAR